MKLTLFGKLAVIALVLGYGYADGQSENTKAKEILIPASPAPISIDLSKTALIIVDMQNDFGAKGGMFERAGVDISSIQNAVAPIVKVLAAARKAGMKVIYTKSAIKADLSDLGESSSPYSKDLLRVGLGETIIAPDGSKSRIHIRDTWNTNIVDELKPQKGDIIVYKSRFSGFYKTELDSVLKRMNIKYLIFTGCTTSVCVESTVRDATFRDYFPLVIADCTAEPIGEKLPRSNKEASLLLMQAILGWVSNSEDVLKALNDNDCLH